MTDPFFADGGAVAPVTMTQAVALLLVCAAFFLLVMGWLARRLNGHVTRETRDGWQQMRHWLDAEEETAEEKLAREGGLTMRLPDGETRHYPLDPETRYRLRMRAADPPTARDDRSGERVPAAMADPERREF